MESLSVSWLYWHCRVIASFWFISALLRLQSLKTLLWVSQKCPNEDKKCKKSLKMQKHKGSFFDTELLAEAA